MSHARQRAMERFGIALGEDDFADIRRQITDGALCVAHQEKGRRVYAVVLSNGAAAHAVQAPGGYIVTILPPTWDAHSTRDERPKRWRRVRGIRGRRRA